MSCRNGFWRGLTIVNDNSSAIRLLECPLSTIVLWFYIVFEARLFDGEYLCGRIRPGLRCLDGRRLVVDGGGSHCGWECGKRSLRKKVENHDDA